MQIQGTYVTDKPMHDSIEELVNTGVYPSKNAIIKEGIRRVLKNPKTEGEN